VLAEADAWLGMSGAKSYEPFLHVERAEFARLRGDDTARLVSPATAAQAPRTYTPKMSP
jgi:hypothetical protein